jgi:hypothetical protein
VRTHPQPHPDREPLVEVRHTADVQGLAVHTVKIDDAEYMVIESPEGVVERFAFTKHTADGGSGEPYKVFVMGGRVVGCQCPDRKYRKRFCKHAAAAKVLLEMDKAANATG